MQGARTLNVLEDFSGFLVGTKNGNVLVLETVQQLCSLRSVQHSVTGSLEGRWNDGF